MAAIDFYMTLTRRERLRTFLLLGLLAVGCSVSQRSKVSSETPAVEVDNVKNPIFVVMGGYNSCVADSQGQTSPTNSALINFVRNLIVASNQVVQQKVLQSLGSDADPRPYLAPRWLFSCFDNKDDIHFLSASQPTVSKIARDNLAPLIAAIVNETGTNHDHPVYIIGHSHGGWLAMQMAKSLPLQIKVQSLFTIDPISPINCNSSTYYRALALAPLTFRLDLAGCQQAPSDITDQDLAIIASRLPPKHWNHYYQKDFVYLHSSAIGGPNGPSFSSDVSPFLSLLFGGSQPSWIAHIGIQSLQQIWYMHKQMLEHDYNRTSMASDDWN